MKQQQTWFYRATVNNHRTQMLEHVGTFEGALLKARRLAEKKFHNWERGKGPDIIVINARTGEKTEMRL